MKTIYKRLWSILLVITMLFSITSMTASAQKSEVPDSESLAAGLEFLAAAFSDLGEDEDQASTGLIAVETPEDSVPAETTQEEVETEAAPEAEQEAEVTVDSPAPSTKAVISEPWDIIRGDIVYADSPFAVGVNGKPVNATNCTYLVQNGVSKIAYCIEPGVAITESAVNSGYTANEEIAAWELLNWDQKEAVALAIAYGYPTVSFDHLNATVAEKYTATQLIIWEIILGDRNAVDFTSYKQYCGYFSPSEYDGLYAVYNEMHAAMVRHSYYPSFTSRSPCDGIENFTYELA